MILNLFNSRKRKFEKSCELSALANLEILNGDPDNKVLELYQQAILACPENPFPYWSVIACLHERKRDTEAFDLFEKAQKLNYQKILSKFKDNKWLTLSGATPVLAIVMPAVIGMLIVLNKISLARNMFILELKRLQSDEMKLDRGIFESVLANEILRLSFNDNKKLLNLLAEIYRDGYLSIEEWQRLNNACVGNMPLKVKFLVRDDKLSEAFACLDFILGIKGVEHFFAIGSRNEVIALKNTICEEIEEEKKWNQNRSDDEFISFLFKRLAFKFHPDLATDENDRMGKTKIMPEINRAYSEKDLIKLEEIARKYVPKWSKYLRKRNQ